MPTPSSTAIDSAQERGRANRPPARMRGASGIAAPMTDERNMTRPAFTGWEMSADPSPSTFSWTVRSRSSRCREKIWTTRYADGRSSPSATSDSSSASWARYGCVVASRA
jgi:hypothetical protein